MRPYQRTFGLWVLVAAVLFFCASCTGGSPAAGPASPYFGTLQTNARTADQERRNGVSVGHLNIMWDRFEPKDGVYDESYILDVRRQLRDFQESGMFVELGLGLNYPPAWLFGKHPHDAFVNQYGQRNTRTPNLVFSEAVRDEAKEYLRRIDKEFSLQTFWAVRAGVSESGELSYPLPVVPGRPEYWGYDTNAQKAGDAPGRPATVAAAPYPGWQPGQPAARGERMTGQRVERWYSWYLASLADAVNWEIRELRALGFTGVVKVLVPGTGFFPADYAVAARDLLVGSKTDSLLGQGTAFYRLIGMLRPRQSVEITTTALVDGSGSPRDNLCGPLPADQDLLRTGSPSVQTWSSARWVSTIARANGFAVSGESAGTQIRRYTPGVMQTAARQAKSCQLSGLMWAFDKDLYLGQRGTTLKDYAALIRRFS